MKWEPAGVKILVIQTAFLGDLVLTTALFEYIKKNYTGHLSVIVNKGTEDILRGNPFVDEVIPFDKKQVKKSIGSLAGFIREIRARKFDMVISPHFSYRSSLISFFSGAVTRIGYRESGFSFLHTRTVKRPLRGVHEVDKLFALVSDRVPDDIRIKRPKLYFEKKDLKKIQSLMAKEKLIKDKFIVVAPSSVWETKRMPEDKFVEVIKNIRKGQRASVVLVGSPRDEELCEKIKKHFQSGVLNLAGKTSLIELSWLISQARAVVTNDSSPIHFASAHNIPTVAIFGATVRDFGYTPLADKNRIAEVSGLSCRPCGIHGGNQCPQKHFKCMNEQNPDYIYELLREVTARK